MVAARDENIAMITAMMATGMVMRMVVKAMERPWRGGAAGRQEAGGVVVVALLLPHHTPGGYSALNPTVGIEAM